MDINKTDHLLEALYRTDAPHGTVMDTQRPGEEHKFNWLDAATPSWLAENADKLIIASTSTIAIRHTARLEYEFTCNGYTGDGPVARGIIPEAIIKEAEMHAAFYLKTRDRLEKLARLDSINRRSKITVLKFPTKGAAHQPQSGLAEGGTEDTEKTRDLAEVYELMRRSHIAGNAHRIVDEPGSSSRSDWLDDATQAELEAATDTILSASAARMAIRMSLRLERAWRQPIWVNNDGMHFKTELLHDLRRERDRAVDFYLKLREAQAKILHNQGIVARSETDTKMSKPRRPHAKTKGVKTA